LGVFQYHTSSCWRRNTKRKENGSGNEKRGQISVAATVAQMDLKNTATCRWRAVNCGLLGALFSKNEIRKGILKQKNVYFSNKKNVG